LFDLGELAEGEFLGHEHIADELALDALAVRDVAAVAGGAAVSVILATISVGVGAAT
jgi:hypothetical protein